MSTRGAVALAVLATIAALMFSMTSSLVMTGAGATFPEPLYRRFLVEFGRTSPLATVRYRAVGSFAGLSQLAAGDAAFAGADVVLDDDKVKVLGGGPVVEVPMCAGAVVAAYNVAGVEALRLDAHVLAGIFTGRITRWDDAAIAALNPSSPLPDAPITAVYRGDESGTSFVFTSFLASRDEDFAKTSGATARLHVAVASAQAANGSAAVVAAVAATPGAVGYVEERFAAEAGLASALVMNDRGAFVAADVAAIDAAVQGAVVQTRDTRVALLPHSESESAYPIAAFSYVIVFRDLHNLKSEKEAQALAQYLHWAVHDGQKLLPKLRFAAVPAAAVPDIDRAIGTLTYKGEPVAVAPTSAR